MHQSPLKTNKPQAHNDKQKKKSYSQAFKPPHRDVRLHNDPRRSHPIPIKRSQFI